MNGYDGGRIARGWYLLGVSWRFLRARPALLSFPALSAALMVVAGLAIFTPLLASGVVGDGRASWLVAALAFGAPATFIAVFCNVAFLTMVQAEFRGERPTLADGLACARARGGAIVVWSLLSLAVGAVLRLLAQIPGGEALGAALSFLGGLAWTLATYFVVPAMVVEDLAPRAAITRSAQTFRARWGESITGDFTAGAAFGILMLPGLFALLLGIFAVADDPDLGVPALIVGVVLTAPLIALQSAVTQLFQLVLFREAVEGVVPGPFTGTDTSAAFKQRRRRRFFGR